MPSDRIPTQAECDYLTCDCDEQCKRIYPPERCTSCMKPIKHGQEWCTTPQCDTDLRDSNNRIPANWVGTR